jgi:hypothetical protein
VFGPAKTAKVTPVISGQHPKKQLFLQNQLFLNYFKRLRNPRSLFVVYSVSAG